MNRALALFTAAGLLLAGCSGTGRAPEEIHPALEDATTCCENFGTLAYKSLPPNYRATFILDQEDPVIEFSSGRSYVEAIALPFASKPLLLQVDSEIRHFGSQAPPAAVFPVIHLLDGKFQTVALLDDLPFEYQRPFFSANRLRMVVRVDADYADARYALIYTTTARRKQGLSLTPPLEILNTSSFETMIYGKPTRSDQMIHFDATGRLRVLAYPLTSS